MECDLLGRVGSPAELPGLVVDSAEGLDDFVLSKEREHADAGPDAEVLEEALLAIGHALLHLNLGEALVDVGDRVGKLAGGLPEDTLVPDQEVHAAELIPLREHAHVSPVLHSLSMACQPYQLYAFVVRCCQEVRVADRVVLVALILDRSRHRMLL